MYVCVCARGGEGEIQGSRCANNLAVPHSHGDPHACSQTHCLCTKLLAHSLTQLLCVCPSIHPSICPARSQPPSLPQHHAGTLCTATISGSLDGSYKKIFMHSSALLGT